MAAAEKLVCRGVWKLFGPGAEGFLARNPAPTREAVAAAGLTPAVIDASLAVAEGECFVIMGLSGSGKSTLVRCLSRLVEPSAGEIRFEGRDLRAASERELIELRRHRMGMVFQHFALLPHLSVLANVAFPLAVQGVARAEREARAREMIALVGLEGREARLPRELSGGQQQRVGIARSLAVGPELWFLDEPFSALDPLIRREMQNEFLRLQSHLRKTIVFITHDFDEAIRLADRIAIMRDGRIIQTGTAEDLILAPADPYVADFTRDAPRAKILSAHAIMRPGGDGPVAGAIEASRRVADFAAEVEAAGAPFAVVENGTRIGSVGRAEVMAILLGRTPEGRA
ncbi:glycine betaine/L-proline ABC transporter ATP-binding protein [Amaricoccus sp.]|uniref:quaternary amine ABC transporter ATP-binding protein n=1 Tax=Amaricoccus sp. TaxID=1872485 RepID=UPI001B53C0AB|nr:ATP-binding cassette domain-containing protein [Amaricoccus sp.]MBP7002650.1 ATP-binding cassette domain-containing protein [Amaricoccus sp.]